MSLDCKITLFSLLLVTITLQTLSDVCDAVGLVPLSVLRPIPAGASLPSPLYVRNAGSSEGESGNAEALLEPVGTMSVGRGMRRALVNQGVIGRTKGDLKLTGFEAQLHFDSSKFGRMQKMQGGAFQAVSTPFTRGMAAASNTVAENSANDVSDRLREATRHRRVLAFLKIILPIIRRRLQARRLQQIQSSGDIAVQQSPQGSTTKPCPFRVSPDDPLDVQIAKKRKAAMIFKHMAKAFLARSLTLQKEVDELLRQQEGASQNAGESHESENSESSEDKNISSSDSTTETDDSALKGTQVPVQTSGSESPSMAGFRKKWLHLHYGNPSAGSGPQ